jgi:DNA-binding CsgD family transcriptional regulator
MAIDERRQSQRLPPIRASAIGVSGAAREELLPVDDVGAGILLVEPGRRFLTVNRFACVLLGYGREELLETPPEEVIVAPPVAAGAAVPDSGTARLRRKDGTSVVVRYEARDVSLGPVRLTFWLVYPRQLLGHPRFRPQQRPVELTARELEILQLLADGCDNDAVAQHLQISRETVKSLVRRLLQKLGANSRTHAVSIALRNALVE